MRILAGEADNFPADDGKHKAGQEMGRKGKRLAPRT
jgi:hypothetical protein